MSNGQKSDKPVGVVTPKRFGLVFEPPQLTLIYLLDGKLREPHRKKPHPIAAC